MALSRPLYADDAVSVKAESGSIPAIGSIHYNSNKIYTYERSSILSQTSELIYFDSRLSN